MHTDATHIRKHTAAAPRMPVMPLLCLSALPPPSRRRTSHTSSSSSTHLAASQELPPPSSACCAFTRALRPWAYRLPLALAPQAGVMRPRMISRQYTHAVAAVRLKHVAAEHDELPVASRLRGRVAAWHRGANRLLSRRLRARLGRIRSLRPGLGWITSWRRLRARLGWSWLRLRARLGWRRLLWVSNLRGVARHFQAKVVRP